MKITVEGLLESGTEMMNPVRLEDDVSKLNVKDMPTWCKIL